MSSTDSRFNFNINRFRVGGITFVSLIVISLATSLYPLLSLYAIIANLDPLENLFLTISYLLFILIPILIALVPQFFKIFSFLPKFFLILSSRRLRFLNRIPYVNIDGFWFIEQHPNRRQINSIPKLLNFIGRHFSDIFIVGSGFYVLMMKISVDFELLTLDELMLGKFMDNPIAVIIVSLAPILTILYLIVVWVWEDAELKIVSVSESTKGENITEVESLWSATGSIKNIAGIISGVSVISWFATNQAGNFEFLNIFPFLSFLISFIIVNFYFGGFVLFSALMYYNSSVHVNIVNNFREYIKNRYLKSLSTGNTEADLQISQTTCIYCKGTGKEHEIILDIPISINRSDVIPLPAAELI